MVHQLGQYNMKKFWKKLFKKEEPALTEPEPLWYSYSVVDENSGFTFVVALACGCGEQVALFTENNEEDFYCVHCDRPCDIENCLSCKAHMEFDAEALKEAYEEGEDFPF